MASEQAVVEVLYIGFGRFLDGVPARDLTAGEWAALPDEARALAVALDLYQVVSEEPEASEEAEGEQDGREDAGVVGDDTPGAADDGVGHRGVPGRRGRKAEG